VVWPVVWRQAADSKVDHQLKQLFAQRVFSIACGYPDANDSASGSDPITRCCWIVIRLRTRSGSQPTLSRFENPWIAATYRMGETLATSVIERHAKRLRGQARRVTIDLDPTDDPTHGAQQMSFFNGHYDSCAICQ